MLVQHLRAAGSPRFGYDHVVVLPASWKVVQTLRYDLSWKYPGLIACRKNPGKETFPPQEENYLDAACMVFEAQALRDVVDYRGAHGVRIVHNGVLDYSGVWVGRVGIGDATGGAVWHAGETMDNANRCGRHSMEVALDKLPSKSTDLYFALSAPSNADISRYEDLTIRIVDSENPGHELTTSIELGEADALEAIVACRMASDGNRGWGVSSIGCTTQGNARDYRPTLLCLRAIQEKKHERGPEWPHQLPILSIQEPLEKMAPGPPRLGGPRHKPVRALKQHADEAISEVEDISNVSTRLRDMNVSSPGKLPPIVQVRAS